ncbi:YeeE/YedE family protein [Sedimenticola selenatireducens]|uniref:YeeE/YedE family protein n=1 Tax=Sedimenticola selenatireducens TaxID=191960 RepID=A0A558DX05_9GAMM|nr:YeeE/YedE family protein [Sedimenticola selenatireducens]TVO75532.1 YeeE/YedE family protein [Sedimenticola selenatireducens]TVT65438.1 MAG: YeeE/YedE family protein [Sedimenticola selenatireducens]
MAFETFIQAQSALLWATFVIALIMGAVVNKTNFCTMGAVSDAVNMSDMGRMRAWFLAIAVAMIGVAILEFIGLVNPVSSFPPYRANQLIWAENILGGLMFGVGMTLASGCGNKTLIRIGGGNLKSIVVLLIIAVIAYFMINPFPGSDQTLMSVLFYDWIRPLAVTFSTPQDLGSVIAGDNAAIGRLVIGSLLGLMLLIYVLKSADFRGSFDNILGGMVVGLAVLAAWYVSSNVVVDLDGEMHSLSGYVQQWDFLADSSEGKPADSRPLSPQSFTFINPMGQALGYTASGFSAKLLTFGVMAFFGVIVGSFLWALVSRGFRIEWFVNLKDFTTHVIGAVLMGIGGVLAMGCTIGQGVTGISTLSVGSFMAMGAIVLGSALTMKVQYYKLVYEEEASFMKALLTGLVDLKLLPERFRKLEAV